MKLVQIEIRHFRGIECCCWRPSEGANCLIGPGDSTKTTILDAIELVLNPRQNQLLEDADFFDCDVGKPIEIIATLTGLPSEFVSEDRYGLHLRGWDADKKALVDEPDSKLIDALSVRCMVGGDLEPRWSLYNNRIKQSSEDPPSLRYKDARLAASVRLGPYADRHLAWGRQSALSRLSSSSESASSQLAAATRAAREAFKSQPNPPFAGTVAVVAALSKKFAVPVRAMYRAALDSQVSMGAGGISLHDGDLPLRVLGTGSSRLLVAAIQHGSGSTSPIALIDELEHGLEPHRIARLVKFLREPGEDGALAQSFFTSHSPVAIREMRAADVFCVRSEGGMTEVRSAEVTASDANTAQRHLRANPDAFLARRVIVCEGETEQGMLRALDEIWAKTTDSFALQGVIAVSGGGSSAPAFACHLATLKHPVLLFLDGDRPLASVIQAELKELGVQCEVWPGNLALEPRMFLDLPWDAVKELIFNVANRSSAESVRDSINARCKKMAIPELADLALPTSLDSTGLREAIGITAHEKDWFKSVSLGEELGRNIEQHLAKMSATPFATGIANVRAWANG